MSAGSASYKRESKAKTAVHGVGCKLESLLSNVQVLPLRGVLLALQNALHVFTPLYQVFNHLGKDTSRSILRW